MATVGLVLILLPLGGNIAAIVGIFVLGLGCAPVYPSIIHATPIHFGAENSGAIIGIEMAAAYSGSCLMPPVFGLIAGYISTGWFPVYIAFFLIVLLIMSERLNRITTTT